MFSIGDIIYLERGHTISVELPMHFAYSNEFGNFKQTISTVITIGQVLNGFDTKDFVGKWVVTAVVVDDKIGGCKVECEYLSSNLPKGYSMSDNVKLTATFRVNMPSYINNNTKDIFVLGKAVPVKWIETEPALKICKICTNAFCKTVTFGVDTNRCPRCYSDLRGS